MIQDIIYGYNLLLVEELSKWLSSDNGWLVEDLGTSSSHLDVASILVSATRHTDYKVNLSGEGFPFNTIKAAPHHFRVDLTYLERLEHEEKTIPNYFLTKPRTVNHEESLLRCTLFFSTNSKAIREWLPGEPFYTRERKVSGGITAVSHPDVLVACGRIFFPIIDPRCHEHLARKLYSAMANFMLTKQRLPDH